MTDFGDDDLWSEERTLEFDRWLRESARNGNVHTITTNGPCNVTAILNGKYRTVNFIGEEEFEVRGARAGVRKPCILMLERGNIQYETPLNNALIVFSKVLNICVAFEDFQNERESSESFVGALYGDDDRIGSW